jgi:predicted transcriptional regulator
MSQSELTRPSSNNPKGKRLSAHKALVAVALREQGLSTRTAGKIAGVSPTSVSKYARHKLLPPGQVDAIKRGLQDRFAVLSNRALDEITDDKLKESSAVELTRVARDAAQMVGIAPPNAQELYLTSIQKYIKITSSP